MQNIFKFASHRCSRSQLKFSVNSNMSPTKSNKPALQGVVNKLSLADAMTLRDAFTYSSILEQCYSTRVDPIFYLSKTFKHPVTLLSAMFDTGCILVGSRALEFFVPGSSRDES